MRWPLYVFEAIFAIAAVVLTMLVWYRRGRGWSENLIIIPWLLGQIALAVYLLSEVIANNWQDIVPQRSYAIMSNALLVAGPLSVVLVMLIRIREAARS